MTRKKEFSEPFEGSFDGLYKDQLVRRIFREERTKRREVFRLFRSEYQAYLERMGDEPADYYHTLDTDDRMIRATVMNRNLKGSGAGPFVDITVETDWIDKGFARSAFTSTRVGLAGNSIGWLERTKSVEASPAAFKIPPEAIVMTSDVSGPRTFGFRRPSRQYIELQQRYGRFANVPTHYWHPTFELMERVELQNRVLGATGMLLGLQPENGVLIPQQLEDA